jgi:integrase
VAGGAVMLAHAVQSYLMVRRSTGVKLVGVGYHLRSFAAFSDARHRHHICCKTAIEWAGLARSPHERARRLGDVIRLARYLRAEDHRHELPSAVFGSEQRPRPVPYIFSTKEIRRLVRGTSQLGPSGSLCSHTYSTLFALLASTGLRVSEALQLRIDDITPDGLLIRCTKFRKARLVAVHPTVRAGLDRYLKRRRPHAPFDDHVFVSCRRRALGLKAAGKAFRIVVRKIGLPRGEGLPRPTMQALRHTFAVRALQSCPDDRERITRHMLALSTYLGHSRVVHTYWYLQATPHLMKGIAESSESFVTKGRRT